MLEYTKGEKACLVQGSPAPVFQMKEYIPSQLICQNCKNSVLIDGYDRNHFIGIRIKCFVCSEITETPALEDGEILPLKLARLAGSNHHLIGSTVTAHRGVVLVCDDEIVRHQELCYPKSSSNQLELTEYGIQRISEQFNELTEGALENQIKSVKKALAAGHTGATEHPFAWACVHVMNELSCGRNAFYSKKDAFAARILLAFNEINSVWGEHPRFHAIARSFSGASTYWHNIFQFIAAHRFFNQGNAVGFKIPEINSGRAADLYSRLDAVNKLWIEIKAPKSFHWPSEDLLNSNDIEKIIKNHMQSSRGQLNRSRRGIIAFSTCIPHQKMDAALEDGITAALKKKGRDHKGIAAIIWATNQISYQNGSNGKLVSMIFNFKTKLNPHFEGENPVKI